MQRREFLASMSSAVVAGTWGRRVQGASVDRTLTARQAKVQLGPSGYPKTEIWGYDGSVPGPEIRVKQGSHLARRFVNELPQASTVHWHGIRIDNRMDGVAGLTQLAVPPGSSFDYDFQVPDAGTYWFHAHNKSVEQVARGLYGALIVEEPDALDIDREEVLVLDDWLLDIVSGQIDPEFESPHERSHAGRRGNLVVSNGVFDFSKEVKRNERLRLRLINAANARIFQLALDGMLGWVIAYDGMPLAEPDWVEGAFLLAPGQRVDLIVDIVADVGKTAFVVRIEDGQGYSQAAFPVNGEMATVARPEPKPLPPNPNMEVSGPGDVRHLQLNMQGGAMGRLNSAVLDGRQRSFRQLVDANLFWSFNSVVGLTDKPLAGLSRGETVHLEINNDTAFPHAMHLHGMHFREVLREGELGPLRDTLLMFSGEIRKVAFVARNPGKWLFHCHMLSHTAAGMATWLRIT